MPIKRQFFITDDHYVHVHYKTKIQSQAHFSNGGYGYGYPHIYHVQHVVRGEIERESNKKTHTQTPPLSNIDAIVEKLKKSLREDKPDAISGLLKEPFILAYLEKEEVTALHTDIASEKQGHYYTYQWYSARPTIEELIHTRPETFKSLLEEALRIDAERHADPANGMHHAIVQQLKELDLAKANLRGLNLTGADLSRTVLNDAELDGTIFAEAVCDGTDFSTCNINKNQLMACSTYVNAKLPPDSWLYWTPEIKEQILLGLQALKTYGQKIIAEGTPKGKLAVTLADELTASINEKGVKYNEDFQRKFFVTLHRHDDSFNVHRKEYKVIIANISLFVLSGVLPYLIVAFNNLRKNGKFGCYRTPESQTRVNKLNRFFPQASVQPVEEEVKGMKLEMRR